MGQQIKFVAQLCQDDFEQNYSNGISFFTLDDYIVRAGNVAADYYRQAWKSMYDELRQEKRDEVVGFDPTVLSEQFVKLERKDNEFVGELSAKAMTLPFDMQTSGYQNIFDVRDGSELERSNLNETWTYKYLPYSCRKFFRIDGNKIKVFTNANGGVKEVRILYVPSIQIGDGDAEIPDGIVEYVITNTVGYMRSMAQGKIVKKTLDQNQNEVFETEANLKQAKP